MSHLDWIIVLYTTFFCLGWCYTFLRLSRLLSTVTVFEEETPTIPNHLPGLSIIIPARNEANNIRQAVTTLIEQDYPGMEIILINDRSIDETGTIIDQLAKEDERIQTIHVQDLPPGWLGKVYALHLGNQRATHEWILFTDADVHFEKNTLLKAIAMAITSRCDHLAILPAPVTNSFLLDMVIKTFGLMFIHNLKVDKIGKPGSKAFIGVGGFNLVKKAALARTEGFQWLRMEVADDVGLGLLLHRWGAKTKFAISLGDIHLVWYPTLIHMFKGLEKNTFGPATGYNFLKLIVMIMLIWGFALAPFIALVCTAIPHIWINSIMAILSISVLATVGKIRFNHGVLTAFFFPVGQIIFSCMLFYSGMKCMFNGGIKWRETKYSLEDLRAGQRVKL